MVVCSGGTMINFRIPVTRWKSVVGMGMDTQMRKPVPQRPVDLFVDSASASDEDEATAGKNWQQEFSDIDDDWNAAVGRSVA